MLTLCIAYLCHHLLPPVPSASLPRQVPSHQGHHFPGQRCLQEERPGRCPTPSDHGQACDPELPVGDRGPLGESPEALDRDGEGAEVPVLAPWAVGGL